MPNLLVSGVADKKKVHSLLKDKYGSGPYNKVVAQRPNEILARLEDNHSRNVLYIDTDTVLMSDPFPFFVGASHVRFSAFSAF